MSTNWNKIKNDYVSGSMSYAQLAEKHGVSYSNLTKISAAEKWTGARKEFRKKVEKRNLEKLEKEASRIGTVFYSASEKLLRKVSRNIDIIPDEDYEAQRKIASTLKDLRECLSVKTDQEKREQDARIRNLEKQLESNDSNNDIVVRIEGGLDEYAK